MHPRLGKILVYGTLLGLRRTCFISSGCCREVVWPARRRLGAGSGRGQREERKKLCPPRADLVACGRALDAWREARGGARQLLAKKLDCTSRLCEMRRRAGPLRPCTGKSWLLARARRTKQRIAANRHAAKRERHCCGVSGCSSSPCRARRRRGAEWLERFAEFVAYGVICALNSLQQSLRRRYTSTQQEDRPCALIELDWPSRRC